MNAWPAVAVAVLCSVFTVLVFRQFRAKRRLCYAFWSGSLLLSALASFAYALTLWTDPHARGWFYLYYICGAMWMPSMMGLGSLALVWRKRSVFITFLIVVVVGIFGTIALGLAPISTATLHSLNGGAGTGVIVASAEWLVPLIVLNSFGAVAVFAVALLSVYRRVQQLVSRRFVFGNVWMAIGIVVISAAGSSARLGWPELFWVTMLIGWLVTFVGYWMLSQR